MNETPHPAALHPAAPRSGARLGPTPRPGPHLRGPGARVTPADVRERVAAILAAAPTSPAERTVSLEAAHQVLADALADVERI